MANQPKKYKKFVATAATATLVASAIVPVASAASFKDVSENNEFAPYIDALTEAGIINGYASTNTFQPGAALTRGQVVKMLGRWVESNGVEIPSDWNTKARFTDVPTNHKDQELVKYAALVADEGVFGGAAGKLMAGNNITRQQMAKVLNGAYAAVNGQSLVEIAEGVDNVRIPDLASARAEFEDAIQALMDLEISSTNSGNFRPLENVTRAQFSKFLYNTINFEASDVAPFEIKAVNSTHVEVIFDKDIENIDKVKFEIEGLEIKGAVVKQTSKRTAVLTTSEQKGGTEYTVKVDGEKAGTFVGIAAVIPTAVKLNTQSVQGVIGEEVTLTAAVTVPEGQSKEGVSVTFNITNSSNNNEKLEVEAFTNAEGVATYKYTRYYSSTDSVTAYATKKSTVYGQGKVYWANAKQLTITDITQGAAFENGAKKVYEINSKNKANGYVFVTFAENLNVTPDKAVSGVRVEGVTTYVKDGNATTVEGTTSFPYQYTTGGTAVTAVKLDANGKANLVLTGSNASVTPIVFEGDYTLNTAGQFLDVPAYSATALQQTGSNVKFELKHTLGLTLKAEGVQRAAIYKNANETGGRDYTVTYTDQNGKVASPGTTVYVALPVTKDANGVVNDIKLFDADGKEVAKLAQSDAKNNYYALTVGAKGEASFTVASSKADTYTAPVAFINNNNDATTFLDTNDQQVAGEITYFVNEVTFAAALKVLDAPNGKPVTSLVSATDTAYFTYELVDQNGKPRAFTESTNVAFQVTAGTGTLTVNGSTTVLPGKTATVEAVIPAGTTQTYVPVKSATPSSVTVSATGSRAGVVLPSTNPATVSVNFTQYGSTANTGVATNVDTVLDVFQVNRVLYSYAEGTYKYNGNTITKAAFENYIAGNAATVSVTVDDKGAFTFNVLSTGAGSVTDVVAKVNAATTVAGVTAALAGYPTFEKLTAADKATVAGNILSDLQGGTAFTAASLEAEIAPYIVITTTANYKAGKAGVTGAVAAGSYVDANDATKSLLIESAAGLTRYNGVTVKFANNADTAKNTVETTYDTTNKVLTVLLPVDSYDLLTGEVTAYDANATVANVTTAIKAFNGGSDLTTATAGAGLTNVADLVGKEIKLNGATASVDAVAGTLTLTFSEAITSFTSLVLNDASTTTITPLAAAKSISADGKTVVITLTAPEEAAVAAATTVTGITATPKVTGQPFKVNGYTAADGSTAVPAAPVTISK